MSETVKKNLVVQGSILALAGLISKVIGFIYRIPMANIMGNTGNGLYSVAFGIYNIALTLSSYSMPLAVSKLMSARLAKGEVKNAHRIFRDALIFASITGAIAAFVLFFGADFLAELYHKEGLEKPLRVLAPTVFVVAILGTSRGYFQGHRNMVPTALSQVAEQIVNAIVSVLAASTFVRLANSANGTNEAMDTSAYGAMGGTMGTLAGAFTALVIFGILFLTGTKQRQQALSGEDALDEDHRMAAKAILMTVLPVILSQTVYQLGYTLDDLIFGNVMNIRGYDPEEVTRLQGVFNTQYNQMINLPVAIATAMASATLPGIVASYTRRNTEAVRHKTDLVLKVNMLVAIPAAVGLAALSEPIMGVLFPGLKEYMPVAVSLLRTGSMAVVFYALSALTTSILQGCDRMNTPVAHSAASLILHVILVAVLIYMDLGVTALVIGNVTFPMCVCTLNGLCLRKKLGYRFEWMQSFVKPLISAFIMGAAAYGSYELMMNQGLSMLLAMAFSMLTAVVVYTACLFLLKAVRKEELSTLPLVGRFFRAGDKK